MLQVQWDSIITEKKEKSFHEIKILVVNESKNNETSCGMALNNAPPESLPIAAQRPHLVSFMLLLTGGNRKSLTDKTEQVFENVYRDGLCILWRRSCGL